MEKKMDYEMATGFIWVPVCHLQNMVQLREAE